MSWVDMFIALENLDVAIFEDKFLDASESLNISGDSIQIFC